MDEILNLIESVSEGFSFYSSIPGPASLISPSADSKGQLSVGGDSVCCARSTV